MSTIMSRSAFKFWLKKMPPANVHHLYKDFSHEPFKVVTWQDIFVERTRKQHTNLRIKRLSAETKPCFIWVFQNKTNFFSGWWVYIKTLKEDYALNFRYPNMRLLLKVMELFPCGILPMEENVDEWAEAFAKQYRHVGFERKKYQGLKTCYCNIDEDGRITDVFTK